MPPLETVGLLHYARRYPTTGVDGQSDKTFGAPTVIRCRWTDDSMESGEPRTDRRTYDGRIATAIDLSIGDVLVKVDSKNRQLLSKPMQVTKTSTRDDVKGRYTRREYSLNRYNEDLPS